MKSKFYFFLTLFVVPLFMAIFLNSCNLIGQGNLKTFTVGLNTWPGYQVALYAQAKGLYRQNGLEVKFVRFTNQQDNIRATMRGAQDASFVPLAEVMQADPNQEQPVFVMVADISAGSDGIAAQPPINSVKDLKGKKVSAKLSTISHLILLEALKANQINPKDIEIVDVGNEHGVEMLKQGEISASVLWEPLLIDTAKAIGGKVIYSTADVDSVVIDGLATHSSLIKDKQYELVQFIKTWFEVMKAIETNPQEVFTVVAEQLGTKTEIFSQDYKGLKKGDLAMNQRMFEGGRLKEASQKTREFLLSDLRHGRIIREDVELNGELLAKATQNGRL